MSKLVRNIALIAALAVLVPVQAQGQFWVGLYGGIGIPAGDYSDFAKTGFSGGVDVSYGFSPRFGIAADFVFGLNSAKDEAPTGFDFDQTVLHYDASVYVIVTPEDSEFFLWIDAGAGASTISFRDTDEATGEKPDSQTNFTIPLGVGFGYSVSENVDLFLRSRAYLMFVDEEFWGEGVSTFIDIPIWAGIGFGVGGGS